MAGLFLSHSSADKALVTKLAIDLVNRGFPVWFDSWEMGFGDSLLDKIYEGVDESTYLVILLSPNSVASHWVEDELNAALMKEKELGRKFIIPLVVAECRIPLKIKDRIYADLSKSYLKELEKLCAILKSKNIHKIAVPLNKQIIPVVFSKGINLHTTVLIERLKNLGLTEKKGLTLDKSQFIVDQDVQYLTLKDRLIERMENIENDRYYSPEFYNSFSSLYQGIFKHEEWLIEGMQIMIDEVPRVGSASSLATTCYWYEKLIRSRILYDLWFAQNPALPNKIKINPECGFAGFGSNSDAAKFFGVSDVLGCKVGPSEIKNGFLSGIRESDSFNAWINVESKAGKELESQLVPECERLKDVGDSELYSKYIIPQMLVRHLRDRSKHLVWDFSDYAIGEW